MKVKSVQQAFYNRTYQRYEMVAPNIYLDWQFNEMDLMALRRSGYIDEIEIKLSRSDYLADFKKTVDVKSAYKCIINGALSHTEAIIKNLNIKRCKRGYQIAIISRFLCRKN